MKSGGCLCEKIRYEFDAEPAAKALCHCSDCKKITGSTYSTNLLVPEATFKVTSGQPKEYVKTADSGNAITSHFCGDCGSTLFRDGLSFPGLKIVKAGTLDGATALEDAKPGLELFAPDRTSWVGGVAGSDEKKAMS